jgi:hypothetical protein
MAKLETASMAECKMHPRLARELKTVLAMIGIHCKSHHQKAGGLCDQCRELSDYAARRLTRCPFREDKTTCGKCPVHCYKPKMREQIIQVMRYSGPRMIFHHPVLAFTHLLDERRSSKTKKSPQSNYKKKN